MCWSGPDQMGVRGTRKFTTWPLMADTCTLCSGRRKTGVRGTETDTSPSNCASGGEQTVWNEAVVDSMDRRTDLWCRDGTQCSQQRSTRNGRVKWPQCRFVFVWRVSPSSQTHPLRQWEWQCLTALSKPSSSSVVAQPESSWPVPRPSQAHLQEAGRLRPG